MEAEGRGATGFVNGVPVFELLPSLLFFFPLAPLSVEELASLPDFTADDDTAVAAFFVVVEELTVLDFCGERIKGGVTESLTFFVAVGVCGSCPVLVEPPVVETVTPAAFVVGAGVTPRLDVRRILSFALPVRFSPGTILHIPT